MDSSYTTNISKTSTLALDELIALEVLCSGQDFHTRKRTNSPSKSNPFSYAQQARNMAANLLPIPSSTSTYSYDIIDSTIKTEGSPHDLRSLAEEMVRSAYNSHDSSPASTITTVTNNLSKKYQPEKFIFSTKKPRLHEHGEFGDTLLFKEEVLKSTSPTDFFVENTMCFRSY